jgi:hypothetical protein
MIELEFLHYTQANLASVNDQNQEGQPQYLELMMASQPSLSPKPLMNSLCHEEKRWLPVDDQLNVAP